MPGLLDRITPLILTFNEAPNIGRTLEKLQWAKEIVIVDSGSTDETLAIAQRFPSVRIVQRPFDSHANQWNFGLTETGIRTPWILALDADYLLSDALVSELARLRPGTDTAGYRSMFAYRLLGRELRSGIYPPVTVLYRREKAYYEQDGHTQRVVVSGDIKALAAKITHDDRKPLGRWLKSQDNYAKLEARELVNSSWRVLSHTDKLRKLIFIAPLLVFFHCLFFKGGIIDGKAGLYYALQRLLAETLLSLRYLELQLEESKPLT